MKRRGPTEIGTPSYPQGVVDHIRRQHRLRQRQHAGRLRWRTWMHLAAGLLAAGILGGATARVPGLGLLDVAAGVTGAALWISRRSDRRQTLRRWRRWAAASRKMATILRRSLGPDWTICWDRHLPGWRDPVTIAVGPGGIWVLLVAAPDQPDPGWVCRQLNGAACRLLAGSGLMVNTRVGSCGTSRRWWNQVVDTATCTPLVLSPGHVHQLVRRLEDETVPDLCSAPTGRTGFRRAAGRR